MVFFSVSRSWSLSWIPSVTPTWLALAVLPSSLLTTAPWLPQYSLSCEKYILHYYLIILVYYPHYLSVVVYVVLGMLVERNVIWETNMKALCCATNWGEPEWAPHRRYSWEISIMVRLSPAHRGWSYELCRTSVTARESVPWPQEEVDILPGKGYSHFVNSHFVNSHFVNSHLVNVDKAGIDKVGIDEVGRFTIRDNFNNCYRSFVRQWTAW